MFGYDYIKEEVKKCNIELKENYNFGLNWGKMFMWIFWGIILTAAGVFFTYDAYIKKGITKEILISLFIIGFGIYFFGMIFKYKITVDVKNGLIIHKKAQIEISKIDSAVLKKMFYKNKLIICIDIITSDKIQMIIPLIMADKVEFACVVKKLLGNKFNIE